MRRIIFCCSILFLIPILTGGCAGPGKPPIIIGQERIVERSREFRPEWIFTPISIQESVLSFSGGVEGRADFSLALRYAKAEAVKHITEVLQGKVQKEFSDAASGLSISKDELGEVSTDTLGMIMDNLIIPGLKPKEIYYEKVERTTAEGVDYFYNCYTLIEISERDYIQARNSALSSIKDRAKAENNKKVEEITAQILKKLSP